jgi:stearoyl-CoA desaturase (delta-9 desaturase)
VLLFGVVSGALIWLTQIAWIPFWAAGVINGIGHYWGYRSWPTPDASTNIVPLGILIGGEELHNNHHAYPTSAKLSSKWYEFARLALHPRARSAGTRPGEASRSGPSHRGAKAGRRRANIAGGDPESLRRPG